MIKVKEDLTGKIFNRLKVIKQVDDYVSSSGRHYARWLCECSCAEHNQIMVLGDSLKSGNTKSCGCFAKEQLIKVCENNKKRNKYRFEENTIYGKCFNVDVEFCFSIEDFDLVSKFCWCLDNSNGYLVSRDSVANRKIYMHKIICQTDNQVDHINRNKLDNRRSNLRPVTQQENRFNNSIRSDNTSGVIGVCWHNQASKWLAQIQVGNTHLYLGVYDKFKDAVVVRLQAELKYFGVEFAPQKHLFEQYGINTYNKNEQIMNGCVGILTK